MTMYNLWNIQISVFGKTCSSLCLPGCLIHSHQQLSYSYRTKSLGPDMMLGLFSHI